jgi:hypothetical protein
MVSPLFRPNTDPLAYFPLDPCPADHREWITADSSSIGCRGRRWSQHRGRRTDGIGKSFAWTFGPPIGMKIGSRIRVSTEWPTNQAQPQILGHLGRFSVRTQYFSGCIPLKRPRRLLQDRFAAEIEAAFWDRYKAITWLLQKARAPSAQNGMV